MSSKFTITQSGEQFVEGEFVWTNTNRLGQICEAGLLIFEEQEVYGFNGFMLWKMDQEDAKIQLNKIMANLK